MIKPTVAFMAYPPVQGATAATTLSLYRNSTDCTYLPFRQNPKTDKEGIFISDLIVNPVDVLGDTVMAAKDRDGNAWVGVRWACDALDMTEGQTKWQVKNIKNDMAFGEGGSNQIHFQQIAECRKFSVSAMTLFLCGLRKSALRKRQERKDQDLRRNS